ncbi:MAG: hypothetical protein AABW64_02980 [Nanoarchaeota archaeon]
MVAKKENNLGFAFETKVRAFFSLYALLAIYGSLIELIGNALLDFRSYPYLSTSTLISTAPLFYPFILMSFRETYVFFFTVLKNNIFAFVMAMVTGILLWEIPGTTAGDWAYTIPFSSIALFGINFVVILGWSLLIAGPLLIYCLLRIRAGK